MILLQSPPKPQTVNEKRQARSLARGVGLRSNGHAISTASYHARRRAIVAAFHAGDFLADPDGRGKSRPNPMNDPAAMEGMMAMVKNQMAMMIPQTVIMGWINAFFSGFVICKFPYSAVVFPPFFSFPSPVSFANCVPLRSETAIPTHAPIQSNAPIRCGNARLGRSLGF